MAFILVATAAALSLHAHAPTRFALRSGRALLVAPGEPFGTPPLPEALKALAAAAKDDVRGVVAVDAAVPLFPDSAYWIGAAFRQWLGSTDMIAVGRDPRTHSFDISTGFCRGAQAYDAGPATTPAMLEALLAPQTPYAGAVMVTASHLPREWNGLKLFSRELRRGLNKKEVKEVMALAVEMGAAGGVPDMSAQVPTLQGFMTPYLAKLRDTVRRAANDGDERRFLGRSARRSELLRGRRRGHGRRRRRANVAATNDDERGCGERSSSEHSE